MRPGQDLSRLAVLSLLVCTACPGTIEDPAAFEAARLDPSTGAAATALDAGPQDADASASAHAPDAARSADAAVDARAADAERDVPNESAARDASADARNLAPEDARVASSDANQDAGPPCNFKALIEAKCGSASCHGNGGTAGGLDLTTDGLAQRVAGRRAKGACGDHLLIDLENPTESALYLKVTDSACGVRMPLGGTLKGDEQQCILQWIERL